MSDQYRIVPVEPTPEMQQAPFVGTIQTQSLTDQMRRHARLTADFKKMCDAAPSSGMVAVPAAELERLREHERVSVLRADYTRQLNEVDRLTAEVQRLAGALKVVRGCVTLSRFAPDLFDTIQRTVDDALAARPDGEVVSGKSKCEKCSLTP